MRALVTGGAGFIGSHLVERLSRDGAHVTAVDDLRGGTSPDDLARWWKGLGVDFQRRSVSEMRVKKGTEVIFHLASPVGPVGVLHAAGTIAYQIVTDARFAAADALEHDALLVFVSTSELYGVQPGPAAEDAACVVSPVHSARQEYALGKLAAETMLLNAPGLRVRVVRPFNIAGPRQRSGGGFVIPRWIEQHAAGEPITVYGTGEQRRAFCHVTDFVDGMVAVAERGMDRRRYNLGNPGNACTLNALADMFRAITNADIVHVDPQALHGPAFAEAPDKEPVIERAARELGFSPVRSNARIIGDALEAVTVR